MIPEAGKLGMLKGDASLMILEEITSRFRIPGHVGPPQIWKASIAAAESAEITTATDNKGEGRFIEELHSVSVRTQRPNRHNSARAEKVPRRFRRTVAFTWPNFSRPRALLRTLKQGVDLMEPIYRSRVHGKRKYAMKIVETLHKDSLSSCAIIVFGVSETDADFLSRLRPLSVWSFRLSDHLSKAIKLNAIECYI
jgi:hypothetical protein